MTALLGLLASCSQEAPIHFEEAGPGLAYAHETVAKVPWSIHIVRVDRSDASLSLHSVHAGGGAVGLEPLTAQLKHIPTSLGAPVAAVNGDFYQRERAFAGDPRGLQIVEGELISAPSGGFSLGWDIPGEPQALQLTSQFNVQWPDGSTTPFGLNEEPKPDAGVLYTPAMGGSTHTVGGRELVLEPLGDTKLPLHLSTRLSVRVREVREGGDTKLSEGTLVLAFGPALARKLPKIGAGAELKLNLATTPQAGEYRNAISGGPLLVRGGKAQKIQPGASDSYAVSSMTERHPRSAVGWNRTHFFLVEVDGRQSDLSVGMTLEELAKFMVRLSCEEAMTFDGGGSSTLWLDGRIRNSPCDGSERPIANALVVTRKAPANP
ncbi:MAG TPA: phosphodiester glycosidase family protein [Candidatus Limnocylindria bacterium]|nr:phosphodiester glycosidase family protein [Candidatus Limnocylindria bacterium]